MKDSFTVMRSDRRTVNLQIQPDGSLLIRAPYFVSEAELRRIVAQNADWIARQREKNAERQIAHPELTPEQENALRKAAHELLPQRVAYWAPKLGVMPSAITITGAKTRFGSCSSQNRISFSWRVMQYPPEAIDYVVVHELAHILHHDHSPAFYACIERVMPDHKARRALLRK